MAEARKAAEAENVIASFANTLSESEKASEDDECMYIEERVRLHPRMRRSLVGLLKDGHFR